MSFAGVDVYSSSDERESLFSQGEGEGEFPGIPPRGATPFPPGQTKPRISKKKQRRYSADLRNSKNHAGERGGNIGDNGEPVVQQYVPIQPNPLFADGSIVTDIPLISRQIGRFSRAALHHSKYLHVVIVQN